MNVLVTGGGGFLGKEIIRKLLDRGDSVFSFSRGFYPELAEMGVTQFKGDLSNRTSVEQAVEGMEQVFHVAAKPGVWGDYKLFHETNFVGTQNILCACRKHNISELIYTSSPSVVFDGQDMEGVNESLPYPEKYHAHYPKTKAMAEMEVIQAAENGMKTIILRPHLIWGPGDNHLVPRILERADKLRKIGSRNNLVDTVYVTNAATAHVLAAEKLRENPELSGRTYFISQDDPIPLWDMIDAILDAGGKPPVQKTIPYKAAWLTGAALEIIYSLFKIKGEPKMTRFIAEELSTSHWFDISAAKKDLGYEPEVSTREGLAHLKSWIESQKI